jgi:AGZA family xanthine/uracil permease-like MFS transporter
LAARERFAYRWAASGDVNAFFGLMIDNISGMILMAALLTSVYGFPSEFVLTRMIPGTAVGVMVGDLLFTWMAFRLAKRERRHDVTAMPLGLDTPSIFGTVFLVLGPAYVSFNAARGGAGLAADNEAAALHAWYVGITMLLVSGVFKLVCAVVSPWVRRWVPRAGLLGSLVAIALVIISFLPLLEIAATPVAGFTSLLLILATLTAGWRLRGPIAAGAASAAVLFVSAFLLTSAGHLPLAGALGVAVILSAGTYVLLGRAGEVPGVFFAVAIGSAVYYALNAAGLGPGPGPRPPSAVTVSLPFPMLDWWPWFAQHWREALSYLPVALPLALATVVGGIDCVESAAAAGDDYPTGPIIAGEGLATLAGGVLGGVIQSTPYIGHPAYKAMGGRAAYTLATAVLMGMTGVFGGFGWIFHVLPKAAVFPILVFVGIEITQHSFRATPRRHYPALVLACVPALAYLAFLMVDRLIQGLGPRASFEQFGPELQQWLQVLAVLSSGFIVTSLIWGTFFARLIDGRWRLAAAVLFAAVPLAFFGVIHSALPGSPTLPPWLAAAELERLGRAKATEFVTPYAWAGTYALMGVTVAVLGKLGAAPRSDAQAERESGGDHGPSA